MDIYKLYRCIQVYIYKYVKRRYIYIEYIKYIYIYIEYIKYIYIEYIFVVLFCFLKEKEVPKHDSRPLGLASRDVNVPPAPK